MCRVKVLLQDLLFILLMLFLVQLYLRFKATRRAVDAAVHAANSAAAHAVSSATAHNAATAANGMHIHTDNVGPSRNTRNR